MTSPSDIAQIAGAIIAYFGGAALLLLALSSWLGKVWANRILSSEKARHDQELARMRIEADQILERLRTESGKQLFVHRLQFEKEFAIYLDLWKACLQLARAARDLRPELDREREGDSVEARLARLDAAYNALSDQVHTNRPFYAPEVFECARLLLSASSREGRDSKRYGLQIPEDDSRERNVEEIEGLVGSISNAIRKRIWVREEPSEV